MIEIYKYYNLLRKCYHYEASTKIGNIGIITGTGDSKREAIDCLKINMDNFLEPLINIDYSDYKFIKSK